MDTELASTFAELDGNGDGQITSAEFRAGIIARGESITDDEITSIFADADADQDGKISYKEFAEAWHRADPA